MFKKTELQKIFNKCASTEGISSLFKKFNLEKKEMINLKTEIMCQFCRKVYKEPVDLPCECILCSEHLFDLTKNFNNNQIQCPICKKVSYVPNDGFTLNVITQRIIDTDAYLNQEEKLLKTHFKASLAELKELFDELEIKQSEIDTIRHNHFAELQKKIELTRDSLKLKIEKISLKMIELTKKSEESFRRKALSNKLTYKKDGIEHSEEKIAENFRNISINEEFTEILKIEQAQKIEEVKAKLDSLEYLKLELKNYEFISNLEFESSAFGSLKLNGDENQELISCSSDGTIKAWDLVKCEQIQLLSGHKSDVFCLQALNKGGRIATGSCDSIKIWNVKTGTCIRTLVGHNDAVMCLKLLSDNQLVSASADTSIKVWDIENAVCLLSLNGHSDQVNCLELSQNGNLISGSNDKSIQTLRKLKKIP